MVTRKGNVIKYTELGPSDETLRLIEEKGKMDISVLLNGSDELRTLQPVDYVFSTRDDYGSIMEAS
jgi:hypothetical protein